MWARVPAGGLEFKVVPNTKESESPPFHRLDIQNNNMLW